MDTEGNETKIDSALPSPQEKSLLILKNKNLLYTHIPPLSSKKKGTSAPSGRGIIPRAIDKLLESAHRMKAQVCFSCMYVRCIIHACQIMSYRTLSCHLSLNVSYPTETYPFLIISYIFDSIQFDTMIPPSDPILPGLGA